ncbi:MAG: rhomboid family intramembrane serine protease [Sporichthyaceae bacterium]|nr:rhomboid family intramembrane serine protease [Sporichthyaceae bacterium]
MISAAVGFQCPNCVREGSRDIRVPRTRLGGKVQANSDIVTKTLIGINVGVFVLALLGGAPLQARLLLIGRGFSADAGGLVGVAHGDWYRLVTAMFLHTQPLHLALNMFALWIFGSQLEPVLGRIRFVTLYLLCGIAGCAASYAFSHPNQASLGASGAVFGLVGAALVIGRRLSWDMSMAATFLGLSLVIGFMSERIDWRAHLGGLVAGLALGAVFAYAPTKLRNPLHLGAAAGVLLVVIVIVGWRTAALS